MTKNFNFLKYKNLVEEDKTLESFGKSLYLENPMKYSELLSYEIILEYNIIYQKKLEYYNLVRSYIHNEISYGSFSSKFFKMEKEAQANLKNCRKNLDQISNLVIDSKEKNFANLIHELSDNFEFVIDIPENQITESKVRLVIEEIFSKMQKIMDLKSRTIYSSEELINRSFTILKASSLLFASLLVIPY